MSLDKGIAAMQTTPPTSPADLITVFVALLTLVTDPKMAELLAPYAVIVIAAIAGAGISVSGKIEDLKPLSAIWYVTVRVMLATVISVSLAELLQSFTGKASARWWVVVVALGVGYFRDRQQLADFVTWLRGLWPNWKSGETPK